MTDSEMIRLLSERLIWIAPVGNKSRVRGYMICHRYLNNPDNGSTAVCYLRVNPKGSDIWKQPFRENECMFPTWESVMDAAKNLLESFK